MINEMMKNPEMMGQMQEMMKNPEMMSQIQEMMKNPDMLSNIMNNLPTDTSNINTPLSTQLYNIDDKIKTKDLSNDIYNNQVGIVVGYNEIKERYQIFLEDLDKDISIKEKNIELLEEENL